MSKMKGERKKSCSIKTPILSVMQCSSQNNHHLKTQTLARICVFGDYEICITYETATAATRASKALLCVAPKAG